MNGELSHRAKSSKPESESKSTSKLKPELELEPEYPVSISGNEVIVQDELYELLGNVFTS